MNINKLYEIYNSCNSVCTDTRKIEKGTMFFALKGPNFNANRLAEEAIEKGAKYAIIDEKAYETENCILVDDVLSTLQELAKHHRGQLKIPVIGITGSNGKTTTKELLNVVLSTQYKTLATQGNYNNHIGVPLTILSISKETEVAIIEMGANHIGEIAFLCDIADPDYGLITNIGKAHIEGFGSFQGVIQAKTELYQHIIKKEGVIFYNSDDEILSRQEKEKNTYSYGTLGNTEIIGEIINAEQLVFSWHKGLMSQKKVKTNLFGAYNLNNALAAICIGDYFKIEEENINKAIQHYIPSNNRSQVIKTKRNILILDAYNANPTSMKAAIESFNMAKDENKVLVLGDMLELGSIEKQEHKNIIEIVVEKALPALFVGKRFYEVRNVAKNNQNINFFKDKTTLIKFLQLEGKKLENRKILIKASRGMQLEDLKEYL